MQYPNVRTIITLICLFYFAPVLMAQCDPVQIAPNSDQCTDWRKMDIEVCHGGTTYTATIEMCTQFASPPNPIDNPCTLAPNECARALDAITWVRSFCVDQDLKKHRRICSSSGNREGDKSLLCKWQFSRCNDSSMYSRIRLYDLAGGVLPCTRNATVYD